MSLARFASTALLVALVTAALPTVAHADSYSRNDPSGDVTKAVFDPDGAVVQPSRTDGDIVRSGVSHGPRRITMALRLRAIGRSANQETIYDFRIGTRKRVREIILTTEPGKWQGGVEFYTGRGNNARCEGIRRSIDYSEKLVTVSVPRRCLGKPRWVRVGMTVSNLVGADVDLYSDDAMTNGTDPDKAIYGPRVYR